MSAWIETETGHSIALGDDGRIVARNAKGKALATVPPAVKKTATYEQLESLAIFLDQHIEEAGRQIETWLLRSLPVPRKVITAVWPDPAWQGWLRDLVVMTPDRELSGLLRAADEDGLGVVDLDGESLTLTDDTILIPHPAVIPDLDEARELAAELGVNQQFNQLFRDVHRPTGVDPTATQLTDWAGGHFDELRFVAARAQSAGFPVQGGFATCTVYEGGRRTVAQFWIGAEYPESETETGPLSWAIDGTDVKVGEVGPIAYSEGVRMATHIYAGRKVEEAQDDDG